MPIAFAYAFEYNEVALIMKNGRFYRKEGGKTKSR